MMTADEFAQALDDLGLKQRDLARIVGKLSGHTLDYTTVNRWTRGRRGVNPLAVAVVKLFAMLPAKTRQKLMD